MVNTLIGDLFESKAQTLVNTVNCIGIMGKGIAQEFKNRFPEMYEEYINLCKAKKVRLGEPYLFKNLFPPHVLNFPTKDHWRSVTKLQDIVKGMKYLEKNYIKWGITSMAVPPLGCGQGQLEWRVVGPTLYRHLKRLSIDVELYAPYGTPTNEIQTSFLDTDPAIEIVDTEFTTPRWIKPGWIALVDILGHIEREPYHWPVGRTIFQKIAYFATELGIPTGFQYSRGSYGPFTTGWKSITTRLVNHNLISEERKGRMFVIKVGPTYKDASEAYKKELDQWRIKIDKIVDLFTRMNTDQAELAATIHFTAKSLSESKEGKPTEIELLDEVKKWKMGRRPRKFSDEELALTVRNLAILGWLEVKASADLPIGNEALMDV